MASAYCSSKTQTSATIVGQANGSASNTRKWIFSLSDGQTKTVTDKSASTSVTFYGLNPGTSYSCKVTYGSTGSNYTAGTAYFTTEAAYYNTDYGSSSFGNATFTTVDEKLTSITSRSYSRTVYFDCENVSSGKTWSPSMTLSAGNTSLSRTASGLNPGTQYKFRIRVVNPAGVETYNSGYTYVTTRDYSLYLSLSTQYGTKGSEVTFTVTFSTALTMSTDITFTLGTRTSTHTIAAGRTSASFTFYVDPNTTYSCSIQDTYGKTAYGTITSAQQYTIRNITTSSTSNTITISADVVNPPSFETSFTFYLSYTGTDTRSFTRTLAANSNKVSGTFSSVPPATACEIWFKDNTRGVTFDKIKRRTKNDFSWSTTVATGAKFNLLASDWNEYTSQLKSKASYYGYSDYSPATVSKGTTFTAVKFNGAAKVINWLVENNKGDCSTKLNGVSAGDNVTANKIKLLALCLNE